MRKNYVANVFKPFCCVYGYGYSLYNYSKKWDKSSDFGCELFDAYDFRGGYIDIYSDVL